MAMEIDREHDVSDWRWKSSFCLLKGSVRLLKGSPIDFMILSASSCFSTRGSIFGNVGERWFLRSQVGDGDNEIRPGYSRAVELADRYIAN